MKTSSGRTNRDLPFLERAENLGKDLEATLKQAVDLLNSVKTLEEKIEAREKA